MSAGGPSKRPAHDAIPTSPDDTESASAHATAAGNKAKLPRFDSSSKPQEDFSALVKNRLNSYTRTGQACDRCKVRKIRCDALPEGCSHCIQQNLQCFVTDRVTGRTERRGYLQELERDKSSLETHIRSLEKLLAENGVEIQPWDSALFAAVQPGVSYDAMGRPVEDPTEKRKWTKVGTAWVKNTDRRGTPTTSRTYLRSGLESRPAQTYLGVGQDSSPLSSINGTQLSILGTTVDITSFSGPDTDEPSPNANAYRPLYNKSIQAFFQTAMKVNPPPDIQLPPRDVAFQYSDWYFRMVFAFLPSIHKPTYMAMLARLYDDPTFKPTPPELVMVHLVMSFVYYQKAVRNQSQSSQEDNDLSNRHYHYAVSRFYDLLSTESVQAVQALAMLAVHCRSFPKPGVSSLVAHHGLHRALDMNLHRAVEHNGPTTNLEIEVRRRAWWCLLAIAVTVNGRLGRPMPLTVDDFDVDPPEAIPDELLSETGVDTSKTGECTYEIGIAGFRLVPLMIEMYSNIYSVRRNPKHYVEIVTSLEDQLRLWRERLPESLRKVPTGQTTGESQIHPLYAQAMELEYRLSLRHPSVGMTADRKFCAENSRISEECAAHMLKVNGALSELRSLDTTWYSVSVYAAAMFSSLVANWERRFEITSPQLQALRKDMESWLNVIRSGASLLGSETQLVQKLKAIVEKTLNMINRDRKQKISKVAAAAPVPKVKQEHTESFAIATAAPAAPVTGSVAAVPSQSHANNSIQRQGAKPYYQDAAGHHHNGDTSAAYPAAMAYQGASFDTPHDYMYSGPAQDTSHSAPTHPQVDVNPLIAFASQATQHIVEPPSHAATDDYLWRQTAQGTNWQDWAAAMADSQDHYGANALLTMGAGVRDPHGTNPEASLDLTGMPTPAAQWPMLLWNDQTHNGGSG